jgi:hypothetical protein
MSNLPFAVQLAAVLAIGWALYALLLIIGYVVFARRYDRDEPSQLLSFDEMDEEAVLSLDNHRRARVLSETRHLPPSVAHHTPPHVRASEDCQ